MARRRTLYRSLRPSIYVAPVSIIMVVTREPDGTASGSKQSFLMEISCRLGFTSQWSLSPESNHKDTTHSEQGTLCICGPEPGIMLAPSPVHHSFIVWKSPKQPSRKKQYSKLMACMLMSMQSPMVREMSRRSEPCSAPT